MPEREQVQLGTQIVELEPQDAATVRAAFANLAQAYGTSLEDQRRQILQSLGTPQVGPAPVVPFLEPSGVDVPDPDLLFQDKTRWANTLASSIEQRLAAQQAHSAALVQGAVAAVDQEFKRRELKDRAQTIHDDTMEAMIERRGLDAHRSLIQTVYNDRYQELQHLPLAMALDQIGQETQAEIARIRGETAAAPAAAEPAQPQPPALLRSARRAGSGAPVPAAAGKTLSDLIRARQAHALGTAA